MADTHVPHRARDLPEQLWRVVAEADLVVHAGDWVCVELLDAVLARSDRLIGVVGNNDGPSLSARLPEIATAQLDGVRLAVVHDTESARGRETRCAARFPDTDVVVFGHSHIPWDTVAPNSRPDRPAAAEPGLPNRPAPPTDLQLDDCRDRGRATPPGPGWHGAVVGHPVPTCSSHCLGPSRASRT
jgi:uncharacterized protein